MAGEWIKMRTDLYRDPRICMIADALMDADGALARSVNQIMQRDMAVTRNVMRSVTVGALVSVWGVMRMRGKRCDEDLIYPNATIEVLDDIADLPGFGEAMASVGWVEHTSKGLIFRNFFNEYNTDPADNAKAKAADRQRRFRNAHRNVTSDVTDNVTVTHREEKRREEEKQDQKKEPRASARTSPPDCPDDVPDSTWRDWLALRKAKRAPVSATVITRSRAEAAKAAMPFAEFLAEWCERGSQGLKAEWLKNSEKRDGQRNSGVVAQGTNDLKRWLDGKRGDACVRLGADDGALRLAVDEAARDVTIARR